MSKTIKKLEIELGEKQLEAIDFKNIATKAQEELVKVSQGFQVLQVENRNMGNIHDNAFNALSELHKEMTAFNESGPVTVNRQFGRMESSVWEVLKLFSRPLTDTK